MNENNIESVMHNYAYAAASSKKQDLKKFHAEQTEPHHSTTPMKRWLILIGLFVFVVVAICIPFYLSQQPLSVLWDVKITWFSDFHAGKFGVPADQTQLLADCIAKSETTTRKYANARMPKIRCSDIDVSWFHRFDNTSSSVGILADLVPADTDIRKVNICYFLDSIERNREFITEYGFENLPNTATWQGLNVSYSGPLTIEDGTMYKVYFKDPGFHICMDIYAPANAQISDLLTAIFG